MFSFCLARDRIADETIRAGVLSIRQAGHMCNRDKFLVGCAVRTGFIDVRKDWCVFFPASTGMWQSS